MKMVFADTSYWIAVTAPSDQWHERARGAGRVLGAVVILTTDEVLNEFLNYFSSRGTIWRDAAAQTVRRILGNPNVRVVPQTRDSFLRGLALYEARSDKGYSLTDCISMEVMREREICEVLTLDRHFQQEGFQNVLMGEDDDN